MGSYFEAYEKDIKRLLDELKKINAILKKDLNDVKAKAQKQKLAPFLTEKAIEQRQKMAAKMDITEKGKAISECGLPGW